MIKFFTSLFGSGIVGAVENVALEAITTDQESAEAKATLFTALDPNGKMRRDLARFATRAYGFYLGSMVILAVLYFFGLGEPDKAKEAMEFLTGLFIPITGAWTAIVSASFGVNVSNNWKAVKLGQ